MAAIKVIYIAGEVRSGTTIIDRILGTIDGATSFCEVREIWRAGFLMNHRCSCGEPVKECGFWNSVRAKAVPDETDIERVIQLQNTVDRARFFLHVYTRFHGSAFGEKLERYKGHLWQLYTALSEFSCDSVLIDSSKVPTTSLILNDIPGIEVYVVHVVRDLRAVVYALQKQKFSSQYDGFMPRWRPLEAITAWMIHNAECDLLARRLPYVRVSYEDFARQPRKVLQGVVEKISPVAAARLPFLDENSIELQALHTVSGNPHRFSSGRVSIELDDEWRTNLAPGTRRLATSLGYPLLSKYGYI